MWAIGSKPNPDETNEKWSEFSAKVRKLWQNPTPAWQDRWFLLRRDFGGIINETQLRGHVAQLVHIVGAAGPNRPATRTDSDVSQGFFFTGGCHVYPHLDEVPAFNLDAI